MQIEDKHDLQSLKQLVQILGGNSNISNVIEGVEELEELIKDSIQNTKDEVLTELKEMYFEDSFGDIHDAIRGYKEEIEQRIREEIDEERSAEE